MTSADVDVVIPTFNAREKVLRCVERLVTQPCVSRVVVVDDASTDGTVEALTDRFPSVLTVRLQEKRGLPHAFIAGAAAGDAEFVLFLSNDIFAAPEAVGRLVESLRKDVGAPSAAGRLGDPGTTNTQVAYQPREFPGLAGLLARITGIERAWPVFEHVGAASTGMHLIMGDCVAASAYFGLLLEARDVCAFKPVTRRPRAALLQVRKLDEGNADRQVRRAAAKHLAKEPAALAISVVIPNYRRPELLRACLPSVLRAAAASAHEVEVIVVDDGSDDSSCEVVRSEFPEVTLIALDRNRGYPTAVNAGVAASHGEWIFTLNNDTTVDEDIFDQLLTVARSAPDVGLVAAQQRFSSDAGIIYSAGMVMDYRGHASDRLMGQPVSVSEQVPVEVFGACGAAALYRRCVLAELGGFDRLFAFGLEDADVAWRARARGWRCLYAPGAIVLHDLGGTVRHGSPTRLFQAGRNRLLLIAKNMERRQLLRHLPQIVSFDVAYVVYAALRLRTLQPLRGRVEGLRLWRTARAAGAAQRAPVELSPPAPFGSALARRRAWRRARPAGTDPAPQWSREH